MDSQNNSEKNSERYDRQVRLWGEAGQQALQNTNLCALSSGAVITETLKNVVLPGIGSVTIVDDKKVKQEDLGNNFFVTVSDLGKSRAEITTKLLQELNDNVRCRYLEEDPVTLISSHLSYFDDFSFVVASGIPKRELLLLDKYLYLKGIPLIVVNTCGFLGSMRVVKKSHVVYDPRPDFGVVNLGFWRDIPDLEEMSGNLNLEEMNDIDHSHVPYPVLLLLARKVYAKEEGNPPKERKDLVKIKEILAKMQRKSDEANFVEATKQVAQILPPSSLPFTTSLLFEEVEKQLGLNATDFWVVVRALKHFCYDNPNNTIGTPYLPVTGVLPDIHSDTTSYIALQTLMRDQSQKDAAVVMSFVNDILSSCGRVPGSISMEYIVSICKHAHEIRHISFSPLQEEEENVDKLGEVFGELWEEEEILNFGNYVLLRASQDFYLKHNHYPGQNLNGPESDHASFKGDIQTILQSFSQSNLISDDQIKELCRYGNAQLHTVASVIGGITAQEIVKLVSGLFLPIHSTFVYNGMKGTTSSFPF
mmetsp:Transcript_361/g.614  ORF Transcript_361/g.614 Transcript_361/m.614 type:complete len:534 (-) Transcript_361:106-1707(-)|eukprot:CAMPEP_0201509780 /NCGR_PEP_ID=MMETSP0161_2-20130828/2734_1 /ASSEMBLY_ACC=CAM_ASM_000251 /TAXON_ID=180227 /ORGANISM="Neoparamoeba aestuarina, Strain SoJaBio B1-5/56/2" /LENGTH=533 /DNA_ID=CAMNT_0047904837 /DNA_START=27 /DNA_END=1628 /DNA_ORIENTATION=+